MIYKGLKGKKVTLYKNILPNTNRIVDNMVKPNNVYKYILRAVFKDGTMSSVTELEVKY